MPLIRGHHNFDDNYTQVPNAWLRDQRLSLAAIGLLAQLLSHRPGWTVSQQKLAHVNNCGRDKIRRLVDELIAAGYLARSERQRHDDLGRLMGYDYTTVDPPLLDLPTQAKPTKENPTQVNHTAKNTITKNTITKNNTEQLFEEFWAVYPNRLGKGEARKAFERAAKRVGLDVVLEGAKRLAADPNLPPKQYVPRPATWLNQDRWEDDPYAPRITDERGKPVKPAAELPGKGTWKLWYHEQGDHTFCEPGEFDCK